MTDGVIARLQRDRWMKLQQIETFRGFIQNARQSIQDAKADAAELADAITTLGADGSDAACREAHDAEQRKLDRQIPRESASPPVTQGPYPLGGIA